MIEADSCPLSFLDPEPFLASSLANLDCLRRFACARDGRRVVDQSARAGSRTGGNGSAAAGGAGREYATGAVADGLVEGGAGFGRECAALFRLHDNLPRRAGLWPDV